MFELAITHRVLHIRGVDTALDHRRPAIDFGVPHAPHVLAVYGSSLFGVGRNVLCGQLQIELSGEQVDHGLEVSD